MASSMFLSLMFLLPLVLLEAKEFDVGGKEGWIVKPSDYYSHWAQANRFQINDTLHFKYNKENDSVLVVKKEDYDSCNTNNPKQKLDDGDSKIKLSDSGLYYFISGNVENCKHGEKVIVLVMGRHQHHPLPTTTPAPSQPPASALSPPQIHSSALDTPAPSPSKASSVGVSMGFGFFWCLVAMQGLFISLCYCCETL
ncbi:hypothetical protein P8452_37187 [Trifolium repens]|nr:hypothetical protein P8452_37187 [Trifolium repens]